MSDATPIETLLAKRFARTASRIDEHAEIECVARAMHADATPTERERAAAVLSRDPLMAEALVVLATSPNVREQHSHARLAGVVLALAAGIALVVGRPWMNEDSGNALVAKGSTDSFAIGAMRGTSRFSVRELATLREGDRLGFFYSTENARHLAILHRDEAGTVTVLVPSADRNTGIRAPAANVPLADGAVVEPGHGCEWFVGVFSDAPIDLSTLRTSLAEAPGSYDATCHLQVTIPGARTVQVVPVRRE